MADRTSKLSNVQARHSQSDGNAGMFLNEPFCVFVPYPAQTRNILSVFQIEQSDVSITRMDVERRSASDDWIHGLDLAFDSYASQEHQHIQMVQIDTTAARPRASSLREGDAGSCSSDDVTNTCVRISADLHHHEVCDQTPSPVEIENVKRASLSPEQQTLLSESGHDEHAQQSCSQTEPSDRNTTSERKSSGDDEECVSLLGIAYSHRSGATSA